MNRLSFKKHPRYAIGLMVVISILCLEVLTWGYLKQDSARRDSVLAPLCKPAVMLSLYQMMKDTDEVLTAHNMPYLLFSGSLLGAVRHQGIIPWDDDIDLALPDSAEPAFKQIIPAFHALGYYVLQASFGYRIVKPMDPKWVWQWGDKTYFWNMACIDVFMLSQSRANTLITLPIWPEHYFMLDELYPLKRYRFGALWVQGPRDAVPYLNRAYGMDWNTVAYRQIQHKAQPHASVRVVLEPAHRVPAQPMGPLADRTAEILASGKAKILP